MRKLLEIMAALGVVAAAVFFWYARAADLRADAQERRAEAAEGVVRAWREAATRSALSADATDSARANLADHLRDHHDRAKRVKAIADAPRSPVPDVCPGPDLDLLRELAEGAARIRAAEDRLRSLRGTGNPGA